MRSWKSTPSRFNKTYYAKWQSCQFHRQFCKTTSNEISRLVNKKNKLVNLENDIDSLRMQKCLKVHVKVGKKKLVPEN